MSVSSPAQPVAARQGAGTAETLRRCRALVQPGLVAAVERLHPWTGEMAAYSLGSGATSGPGARFGGKGVRQALAVLGAEAAGASGAVAVPGAVAVELVHTFSLLHDDIMDGDETRRQRAAAWRAYGTGPAVLAGDALFALAVEVLADARTLHCATAVRHLSRTLADLVHGQADDLLFESRPWVGPGAVGVAEYCGMAGNKTGALLGCSLALGAVLAGACEETAEAMARAGRHAGIAFQAADDLLGIWGAPERTGKPAFSDLRRGKKTLPVLTALAGAGPAEREHLCASLAAVGTADGAAGESGLRGLALLIEEAGGRAATLAEARTHLALARTVLLSVPLATAARDDLLLLLDALVDRDG